MKTLWSTRAAVYARAATRKQMPPPMNIHSTPQVCKVILRLQPWQGIEQEKAAADKRKQGQTGKSLALGACHA